jgi:hypothetical protein
MIKVLYAEGRYRPIVLCDVCREQIVDAKKAVATSNMKVVAGNFTGAIYAHKGKCHDEAEANLGKAHAGWVDLETHFLQLLYNAGWRPEHLQEWQERQRLMTEMFSNVKG